MCAGWSGLFRERNVPETVDFVPSSVYNCFAVLRHYDKVFREGGNAIVIT